MNTITISSLFVLFAMLVGIIATTPLAFAAEVSAPAGSAAPGCEITDECFIPATVSIDVGETVTWSNDDTAAHTVTSGSAGDGPDGMFDSSLFMAGATFDVTFDTAGTYSYFCMVHPWMVGTVIVGEAMAEEPMMAEGILVEISPSEGTHNQAMTIDLTFTDLEGGAVEHVNYDITATQGTEIVLDEKGVHDHDGMMSHTTMELPVDASDAMPVDIRVTFNGFGIDEPFTGPIGEVKTMQVVPEFGTIAMIILGVSIMSIIAVTAKSKIIPRI